MKNKIIKNDKDGKESVETISYKIKFIDSVRFMGTSLSNLVDNLTEGIHKIISSIEETFQFNEDLIKSYNGESEEGYFLQVDI